MKQFKKSSYIYTSLFCEENIWHFSNSLIDQGIKDKEITILFITNKRNKIAISNQLAADHGETVVWDYHVILLANINHSYYIFDFDSRLPFPCNFKYYLQNSLPDNINNEYSSQFRLIPANKYLNELNSNRNHMKGIISSSLFPPYPEILAKNSNKLYLTDLFDTEKEIQDTRVFQNKDLLINWVAEQ